MTSSAVDRATTAQLDAAHTLEFLRSPPGNRPAQTPAQEVTDKPRSPSTYLWAMLLARIYEVFPLVCPRCAAPMTLIAFVTETGAIQRILAHLGEPATPPPIAAARGPPGWEDFDRREAAVLSEFIPAYEFDQTLTG